ncbi:unnamed protein product [Dovyalis caffra]|uniref:Uncharacterized protein n=1 Tax=Dovyalis caffra TaxID=77055 RepID=A0AAV1SKH6_9ROSI|nr:unnamed protein product [Dovyalis caffra]
MRALPRTDNNSDLMRFQIAWDGFAEQEKWNENEKNCHSEELYTGSTNEDRGTKTSPASRAEPDFRLAYTSIHEKKDAINLALLTDDE